MNDPIYTQDWISPYFPLWERLLPKTPGQRVLEIGCFEGRATRWFLQNLPDSHVTCIDTFEGGADHKELGLNFAGVKWRFNHNIDPWQVPLAKRVSLYDTTSERALHIISNFRHKFDLSLIDGSHVASDVISDAVLTWTLMKQGGIIIFDDYGWGSGRPMEQTPAPAIDSFLICYKDQYEVLEKGYQVIIQKL